MTELLLQKNYIVPFYSSFVSFYNSDHDKTWPLNTPGAQEAEDDIHQQTPTPENNTQRLREQMQNSNEVTEESTNIHFTNLKIPIL